MTPAPRALKPAREQQTHELKIWPEFFAAVVTGAKKFEVRKNDRDYQVGDTLILKEWDTSRQNFTGRSVERRVSYVMRGGRFDLPAHLCVISMVEVSALEKEWRS